MQSSFLASSQECALEAPPPAMVKEAEPPVVHFQAEPGNESCILFFILLK